MNISINNHLYEAKKGERLLDIARGNQVHIGYFCGGNTICQTCYVKVLEGGELLSPLSAEEKAILSDKLVKEGTRMACMTTVEKEGTLKVVSLVEELKQVFETNPLQLTEYAATMGWESVVKLPDTMRMQAGRDFDLWLIISDIISGIGDALQLVFNAFVPSYSEKQHQNGKDNSGTCTPFQLSALCSRGPEQDMQQARKHRAA